MHKPASLAVIGTGKRFFTHYVSFIKAVCTAEGYELAGIWNRNPAKRKEAADALSTHAFPDFASLMATRPTVVVNLIKGPAKQYYALKILRGGSHLHLETPAGVSSRKVRELMKAAGINQRIVGVAEDVRILPNSIREQERVSTAGGPETVHSVTNQEATFSYHAFARLSAVLGPLPPVTAYQSRSEFVSGRRVLAQECTFANGQTYRERFSIPKDAARRAQGTWTIHGTTYEQESLVRDTPEGAKTQALALLLADTLRAITDGREPLYTLQQAERDIHIWRSMNLSRFFPGPAWLIEALEHLS